MTLELDIVCKHPKMDADDPREDEMQQHDDRLCAMRWGLRLAQQHARTSAIIWMYGR